MKTGVLTSSRADFGIYQPLLSRLESDPFFDLTIIAFGTHCSEFHGKTVRRIRKAGYTNIDQIRSLVAGDDEASIATSYGLTGIKFADYWASNRFDLVFCLGDRFEMSAAVQAGIPFGIPFAHIHGGETTLGAIDNIYRHQITLASRYHFTSTREYAEKVKQLIGTGDRVYTVGALSLDGLDKVQIVDDETLREHYSIPEGEFILATVHPETVRAGKNREHVREWAGAVRELAEDFIFVITLPNADTFGTLFRDSIQEVKKSLPTRIITVENMGRDHYFSAMAHAKLLLGNSSSGIIEAASFNKYVVNIGERQAGRAQSKNVLNCPFDKGRIIQAVRKAINSGPYEGENIYYRKNTAKQIADIIKTDYEEL